MQGEPQVQDERERLTLEGRDARIQSLLRNLLLELGEDPNREGLLKTPARVRESLDFLTEGYGKDPLEIVEGAIYHVDYQDQVLIKAIDFFSLCEHHLLPFFGKCHVAYIPNGRIVGLSKIPRLIEVYARRLQVQERLTCEIANAVAELLEARGVAVIMEAAHLCMSMRGVEQPNALTQTSMYLGTYRDSESLRLELLKLLASG